MTQEEAQRAIRFGEACGFTEAKVSIAPGVMVSAHANGFRTNRRVIWQARPEHVVELFRRLKPHLPERYERDGSTWVPCGLNERIRFYKYTKGQQFKRHFDGGYTRPSRNAAGNLEQSFMTLIVYLNSEGIVGGETTFFADTGKPAYRVKPETGKALLFWHDHKLSPLHEGSLLKEGTKYAFRSDIMFEKQPRKKEKKRRKMKGKEKETEKEKENNDTRTKAKENEGKGE